MMGVVEVLDDGGIGEVEVIRYGVIAGGVLR